MTRSFSLWTSPTCNWLCCVMSCDHKSLSFVHPFSTMPACDIPVYLTHRKGGLAWRWRQSLCDDQNTTSEVVASPLPLAEAWRKWSDGAPQRAPRFKQFTSAKARSEIMAVNDVVIRNILLSLRSTPVASTSTTTCASSVAGAAHACVALSVDSASSSSLGAPSPLSFSYTYPHIYTPLTRDSSARLIGRSPLSSPLKANIRRFNPLWNLYPKVGI